MKGLNFLYSLCMCLCYSHTVIFKCSSWFYSPNPTLLNSCNGILLRYNIKLVLKLTSLRRNITHLLIISHVHKLHDPLLYVRSAAIPKVPLGSAQFCQELFGFGRRNCN